MDDIELIETIEAVRETMRGVVVDLDGVLARVVRADYRVASPARMQECLAEVVLGLDSSKPEDLRRIGRKIGLAEAFGSARGFGGGGERVGAGINGVVSGAKGRGKSWVIQEHAVLDVAEVEIDAKFGEGLRYLSLPAAGFDGGESDIGDGVNGTGVDVGDAGAGGGVGEGRPASAGRDAAGAVEGVGDASLIVPQRVPSRFGYELTRCISLRRVLDCVRLRLPCLKGLAVYDFLVAVGYPVAAPAPDAVRFARYMGLISGDERGGAEQFITVAERAARLTGTPVAQVGHLLGLYAGAVKVDGFEAICRGKKPQCGVCRLTGRCLHFPVVAAAMAAASAVAAAKAAPRGNPIKDWNVDERPRERLLAGERLSNSELLALILRSGSGRLSAVELGRELIHEFGTLHDLERAGPLEIVERMRGKGIGPAKAAEICAAIELGKRVSQPAADTRLGMKQIGSSRDIFELCRPRYKAATQEEFLLLILNTKNRLQKEVPVSLGTLNSSIVHPRDVFRHALREAAAAVIFVHNHPSGDPSPSDEDILLTARLADAGKLLGIQVLDHVIIGSHEWYSFADHGRMK